MAIKLSLVICTYNPRLEYLAETLASLRHQMPLDPGLEWELIIVDNASPQPLEGQIDLSWHPSARVVREEKLGLTHARLRSFHEARGELILYVDDDNILDPNYLRQTVAAFDNNPNLGAAGGRALPRYEALPPRWFAQLGISLACRDLGDSEIWADWLDEHSSTREYPHCAPIGAGMGIRRAAYANYIAAVTGDPIREALGRKGSDLASGEDNDMILTLLSKGWRIAYLPTLTLEHLIPARRVEASYLADYAYSSNKTWMIVLWVHGINPWPPISTWSAPLRKARAYLRARAWKSAAHHIQWRGMCGAFDGRTALTKIRRT